MREFQRVKRQFLPIHPGLAAAKVVSLFFSAKVSFKIVLGRRGKKGGFPNFIFRG